MNVRNVFSVLITITLSLSYSIAQDLGGIKDVFDPLYKKCDIGAAALLYKNGKTEILSVGDYALNEHSVFNIGSGSKVFTAILILQEMENGNLQLSDSIGTFLSPIKNVNGSLTIRHLLQHESGLGEMAGADYQSYYYSKNINDFSTNFLDQIPEGDTSMIGKYNYCNTNYILLGHILESVSDRLFFELLRERIFQPCGMNETYPYLSKSIPNLAHPTDNGVDVFDDLHARYYTKYVFSAGSIGSTLSDLQKFYSILHNSSQLLKPSTVEQMLHFNEGDYGFAVMTLELDGTTYYGHGGENVGYSYRNYYDPKTNNMLLLFGNGYMLPFRSLLRDDMLAVLHNKPATTHFDTNTPKTFSKYIGKYMLEEAQLPLTISEKEGDLYLGVQGIELLLVSHEKNTLEAGNHGIKIEITDKKEVRFKQGEMEAILIRVKK